MKELWLLLGVISLILGLIGIILPILPTTPFLIVTAYGFSKGNKKFHNWFMSSKLVRKFSLQMEMTKKKKIILNVIVDALLVFYITIYRTLWMTIILLIVIAVKHVIFHKYVKTT